MPLASTALLQAILPCSFHVESVLGGRELRSGISLFDVQGTIATLVPYDNELVAVQSIAPQLPGGLGSLATSNRICVIDLVEVGWGPGGTVYEVSDAFCDDCNDTECVANCTMSVGWILTIPGGLTTITGQDN